MKHILITILAVLLVGCGKSQQSVPESEIPTPKPVVSIHSAAGLGEDEIVKQHLADGIDINLKDEFGYTPLHKAVNSRYFEIGVCSMIDYCGWYVAGSYSPWSFATYFSWYIAVSSD